MKTYRSILPCHQIAFLPRQRGSGFRCDLILLLFASLVLGVGCQSRPVVKWGGLSVGQGKAVIFDPTKAGSPDFQVRFPDGTFRDPQEIVKRDIVREITRNSTAYPPPWGGNDTKRYYRSGNLVGQITIWHNFSEAPDDHRLYFRHGTMIVAFERGGEGLTWLETYADKSCDCEAVKPAIRNPRTGRIVELPAKGDELRALRTLFDVPEG